MREIKVSTKYKHFEGKKFMVLGFSNPVKDDEFNDKYEVDTIFKGTKKHIPVHVTTNTAFTSYRHDEKLYNGKLVIYVALYGKHSVYTKPYETFIEEVNKEEHPEATQKYIFEEEI